MTDDETELRKAAKLRVLRPLIVISPILTFALLYAVLHYFAKLDVNLALVISIVFGALEWLVLAGLMRKLQSDDRSIG